MCPSSLRAARLRRLTVLTASTLAAPSAVRAEEPPSSVEVTVRGANDGARLRESAQAVHVVETTNARRESADLGEVLARSQGVGVRRGGGLGSSTRFALNGLTDEQVRFFLDGVPLELAGYPAGIANVPVNLVQRIEIYRGVVPVRFGADALGGAVNVVSDQDVRGTHGGASYEIGSFGTHRATATVHTHDPATGLFARASGFWDHADNDYPIQADVVDASGTPTRATVDRFHDGYDAIGANVELGFVRKPWARQLLVRAFVTDAGKELQNNPYGEVPYGDASFARRSFGVSARYEHLLARHLLVDGVVGAARTDTLFRDLGTCVWDWLGRCVRQRTTPGEIEGKPHDLVTWDRSAYARLNLGWTFDADHAIRLALAPTYAFRTADERRQSDPTALDPQTGDRRLFTFVSGVEETSRFADRALENIVFAKDYFQVARAQNALIGSGTFKDEARDTHRVGFGDSLRYRFTSWLYAKASYEWATRLPSVLETFGDGVLVTDNLALQPERSHNGNLGFTIDRRETPLGDFRADTNGFVRAADDLIVLLGNERSFTYQNVYGARALGIEAASGWTSPGEWLSLDGNVTYQDFRNTEDSGTFSTFEGDRIPNRPYFFANGSARFLVRGLVSRRDELSCTWNSRWVHSFYRSWESAGSKDQKPVVPSQLVHSIVVAYLARSGPTTGTLSGEIQNLTGQRVYDFFGVQRPGRAFYLKSTIEF